MSKTKPEETSKPTRSSRRRERSRLALIDAAREVMSVKGVDSTTINDITEAADLGFGTFYNHFKSKDEIVVAAMEGMVSNLGDEIDALIADIEDPVFAQVTAWQQVINLAVSEPIWGWFILRSSQTMGMMNEGLLSRFKRDVTEGMASGAFKVNDLSVVSVLLASGLLALINGRLTDSLSDQQIEEGLAQLVTMLGVDIETARRVAAQPKPSL